MRIEVDQSGKIEQTDKNTALAFSNDISYVVLIPARVKREAINLLRVTGKRGKNLYISLFAAALYQLLKDHLDRVDLIVIDMEYEGNEQDVKLALLNLIWQRHPTYPAANITFRCIGKKSTAHKKALAAYRGVATADRTLKVEELLVSVVGKKQKRSGKPFRGGP
ncbi:MAG: hypothetical protein WBW48_13815 [Anaerolineae bacterium]